MAYAFRRENKGTPSFTGVYEGPDGTRRSAGTFPSRRAALRAAQREEQAVREGRWWDRSLGDITFEAYVENSWLPSKHLEATTRAAYRSYLDRHFLPFFGSRPMARILPSLVQEWVTKATAKGLSPRSVRKYHVMLHSIFERAVRDQLILMNPCEHTELPKIIVRRTQTLTPDEFARLIAAILRPRHIDFLRRTVTVEETIVEVSKKHSGTGERMIIKPYPKDDESRTFGVRSAWLEEVAEHIRVHEIGRDDLLFSTEVGTPISRNTFRTRVWLPAVKSSGIDFAVRVHDLRHAHASWLLAGGADLKGVMDRMGHAQIQTTQKYLHTA
jgi:site-specific recombinase XerD